jgi:hypothetical protein
MPERQIVGGGRDDIVVAEDPGRAQRIGPGLGRLIMPVRRATCQRVERGRGPRSGAMLK